MKKIFVLAVIIFTCLVFKLYKLNEVSQYYSFQNEIINSADNYLEYELLSADKNYVLQTKKISVNGILYATFIIKNSEGEPIYRCFDNYRLFDLKNIRWDGLDVVVESSDVGSIIYKYDNMAWNRE